jgi:hypothetical protein
VFLQNSRAPAIFNNYQIIFLLKNWWNRSMMRWTESMTPVHGVYGISLNEGHPSGDLRLVLKQRRGISSFNLERWSTDEWRHWLLPHFPSVSETEVGSAMAAGLGVVLARATGHQMQWGFFLRDLGGERNPICPLTVVEMIERKLVVGLASNGTLVPRTPPAMVV